MKLIQKSNLLLQKITKIYNKITLKEKNLLIHTCNFDVP